MIFIMIGMIFDMIGMIFDMIGIIFDMIGMIFDMIGVRDERQHGDAIPVSQQIRRVRYTRHTTHDTLHTTHYFIVHSTSSTLPSPGEDLECLPSSPLPHQLPLHLLLLALHGWNGPAIPLPYHGTGAKHAPSS